MALTMKTTVTQGIQSVANNTTTVSVKTVVTSTYGSYNHNSPSGTYKIYKNNTSGAVLASGSFSKNFDANTTTTILSKSFTLEHESDGTLDIVVVVSFVTGISAGTLKNTVSKSLTDIPRASTVTAVSCNIGEATTITINRKASTFSHTLQYGYGKTPSSFKNIVSYTTSTSYGWKVPAEAYAQCVDAKFVYITIRCYTYTGTPSQGYTKIGYDDYVFKAYADSEECKPIVAISAEDINTHALALTGDSSRVIKGVSTLSYTVSATPKNEAELQSVVVQNGTQKLTEYSGVFKNVTSASTKATVTDSRNYSQSDTEKLTLIDYKILSITASISWQTPTGGVIDITLSGNYSDIDFGAISNSLKLQYKLIPKSLYDSNSSNLTNTSYVDVPVEPTITNGKFSVSFSIGSLTSSNELLDYREAYSFRFRAIDEVFDNSDGYSPKSVTKHLSAALPIFDWGEKDFNFNVPVFINNKTKLFYEAGDSTIVKSTNGVFTGFVSNSGKDFYAIIPLCKPVLASNVKLIGSIVGRGVNGYIKGDAPSNSAIDLSNTGEEYVVTAIVTEIGIGLVIAFTEATSNVVNNTPVSFMAYGDITIEFS